MIAPGYIFSTDEHDLPVLESAMAESRAEYGHFRISFAYVEVRPVHPIKMFYSIGLWFLERAH